MVGLGGHVGVIVVTMTTTVTKLYHPFGAAPLLGLQTVLRVPASYNHELNAVEYVLLIE